MSEQLLRGGVFRWNGRRGTVFPVAVTIDVGDNGIFADGFESGDTTRWSM